MKKHIISTLIILTTLLTSAYAAGTFSYQNFYIKNDYTALMTITYSSLTYNNPCGVIIINDGVEDSIVHISYNQDLSFQLAIQTDWDQNCKEEVTYADNQNNVIAQTYLELISGEVYYTPFHIFANDLKIKYNMSFNQTSGTFIKENAKTLLE